MANFANKTVLIVDDEESVCEALCALLEKEGYRPVPTLTAREAVTAVKHGEQDLVILDIALGDADGLEVLDVIKDIRPAMPVLILTGLGFDEELLQEALNKGAAGYVSKGCRRNSCCWR